MSNRTRYAQLGVPAAALGVLASAFAAAPATAAAPASAVPVDIGSLQRLPGLPQPVVAPAKPVAVTRSPVKQAQSAPASYTVQPGDTIAGIAHRFGLATVDVLAWNDLGWRSVIYPGQTIRLSAAPAAAAAAAPAPTATARTHVVAAGDTIFGIAQKNGTSVDAILAANELSSGAVIYPGQEIAVSGTAAPTAASAPAATPPAAPAPASAAASHTVAAGDTLWAIAQKHGITVAELYAANGLEPSSIIYPGQRLKIAAAAAPASAPSPASKASTPHSTTLNSPQAENAALIIKIGRELGVSDRGIAIALATSMVESWLRNLDWGDRDSLGLFQQRPSTGWGTAEQIMDRAHSIRSFFHGQSNPDGTITHGLLDVPGWESMPFGDAAQAVQISAYPERYGPWEDAAYEWLALYG
ncbi:muramidase family protein [Microbacterium abyssi]|uniref:muramidase family protein n=1 Tax=Microbacterium abyssi TaxID=2782166 RepID=UPI001E3342B1|nr:LysM peptidoglycan-binding domain-containing protein [Microbacterium sp. A18JL241]